MLLLVAKLLGALSAYGRPGQIAIAMALGLSLAIIPGGTLIWFLLFIPMMLIRINQAALLGTMGVFRLLAPLIDPITEKLGFFLLTRAPIEDPMTRLLDLPLMSWFRFNDSLIFGALILGLGGLPVYFIFFRLFVSLFRKYLAGPLRGLFRKIGAKVPWAKRFGSAVGAARRIGGAA